MCVGINIVKESGVSRRIRLFFSRRPAYQQNTTDLLSVNCFYVPYTNPTRTSDRTKKIMDSHYQVVSVLFVFFDSSCPLNNLVWVCGLIRWSYVMIWKSLLLLFSLSFQSLMFVYSEWFLDALIFDPSEVWIVRKIILSNWLFYSPFGRLSYFDFLSRWRSCDVDCVCETMITKIAKSKKKKNIVGVLLTSHSVLLKWRIHLKTEKKCFNAEMQDDICMLKTNKTLLY